MSWIDKAKGLAGKAGNAVSDVAGSVTERAKGIDLSGVTERVSGAYRATVDAAGDVVDAAGNRVTHPSKAFDEGVAAGRAAEGDVENPYE